jgi:3-methyladenine DNA glycosylase AlkC
MRMSDVLPEPTSFINPDTGRVSIALAYGTELAKLLAVKLQSVYPKFATHNFIDHVTQAVEGKSYKERIEVFADALKQYLPDDYITSIIVLQNILGPENPQQTGMFTQYYWLMPVSKFIEKYGTQYALESLMAIAELTKRCTGEYAIRPFARLYPEQTLQACTMWAKSANFHLRRLASEGLRPKLPWATKLDVWVNNPQPVFTILELLKEDEILFVKKSVANHLRDYVKVNEAAAKQLIARWKKSDNIHTQWILKHALRK